MLVETIEEGDRVKAEIVRILTKEHQKEFSKEGVWPKKFTTKRELDEDILNDDGLHRNLNRPPMEQDSDSSNSSD